MTVGPMGLILLLCLALTTGDIAVTTDDIKTDTDIPEVVVEQMEAIVIAASHNELAILECEHIETGKPVYTLCRVIELEDKYDVYPITTLDGADPIEFVVPPAPFQRPISEVN